MAATPKTFQHNGKVIKLAEGKMQFNTANAQFRKDFQYRFDAAVQFADKCEIAKDNIKALESVIEFKEKSAFHSSDEVDGLKADIETLKEGIKALKKEFEDNAPTLTEADENLYLAYRDYMEEREDEKNGNTYFRAFCEWADFYGMIPTKAQFAYISKKIGAKKLGNKALIKNNATKFTTYLGSNQFYNLFFATILEILRERNLLRSYEFEYKFPVKEKKSTKKA